MNDTPKNGFLPRKTFFWIMGILVMVMVTIFGYQIGKIDKLSDQFNHNFTTVSVDIAEIKTDLKLLRESFT